MFDGIVILFVGGKASFVVCRIFEKNGTGPQNGAQYGAPFVEEEWEEEEGADFVPLREVAPDGVIMDPQYSSGEQDSGHSDDFEQVVHVFIFLISHNSSSSCCLDAKVR